MEHATAPPELWVRDPLDYLGVILETPWATVRTVWTSKFLLDTGISPRKALDILLPAGNWEALALDDDWAYFMTGKDRKTRKWPRWTYGDSLKTLMELFGSGKRFVVDFPGLDVPKKERDDFENYYHNFQRACPDAKPHIHGAVAYSKSIGLHPYSCDLDPTHLPDRDSVQLPNGRLVREYELKRILNPNADMKTKKEHQYWLKMIGYSSFHQVAEYVDKVRFEFASMAWAIQYWDTITDATIHGIPRVQTPTSYTDEELDKSFLERLSEMSGPDAVYRPKGNADRGSWSWYGRKPLPTDRIACDTCSLADVCRAFRQGSVCAVPGTEGESLQKRFGTRSSSSIISGLQDLMKINTTRIERALDAEEQTYQEDKGSLDPELTKLIDKTIQHGEKVAKLIDPRLRPGPAAQVLINNQNGSGQNQLAHATPQQMTAAVVRELEARGVKREDITPEVINDHVKVLSNMSPNGDFNDYGDDDIVDAEVE